MLQDPLNVVLGTKTKVKLLRSLIFLDRFVTGREAARLAGVSHIAQQALDELVLAGILERRTTPGGHIYRMNEGNYLFPSLCSLYESERKRYSIIIESIQTVLGRFPEVLAAAFFGSAARDEEAAESDLDLLVILEKGATKEGIQDSLTELASRLLPEHGITLSPVVLTMAELSLQMDDQYSFAAQALNWTRNVYGPPVEELLHGEAV